ncbi:cytochrome c oxidase accessory protein CcoG [Idiomarina sp. UBA4520]|jgi:cytochrome c oxidase accessory protein FixG|uniref:cytochrome c oxidase accessory protein CcoG n=1 Tax=Idiomarina sp. UBA4520 TaxID=1946647 RepID=UPI000A6CC45F|nr:MULTISPECIES: cytochrome c oxidase accessory protein CcoG [unclassified Idiomarina]|tara:strand:- start:9833 stop:11269 length:1437 start_codon:yes stop_codon:yes gene_type:complete
MEHKQKITVQSADKVKIQRPDGQKHNNNYSPRSRIYVRSVKGALEYFRRSFGFILLGVFALLPWLTYQGEQAILLDIMEQRFRIYGLTLWPQDFTVVAWFAIVAAVALFFVTTIFGRVWCGFMCPQTTWTFIFMWFEKKFEGPRNKRIKLDERKMDFDKLWRKTAKQVSWVLVALLTSMSFVGYFTDIRELFISFFTLDAGFWATFSVLFFTFCTYGNAGYMREIMCTHMCPYARFQSAMFDKDTYTVSYDAERGEPRGPRSRKTDPAEKGLGHCIDCYMCVQVCPTGIDIRNGLQYECIDCGACIDACNEVMDKMNYPRGLIRFTTERNLAAKEKKQKTNPWRMKSIGYFIMLLAVSAVLIWDVATRIPLEVDVLRDRNQLYRENIEGQIENVFTLKLVNKSQQDQTYRIEVKGFEQFELIGETTKDVSAGEVGTMPVTLAVPPTLLDGQVTEFYFVVTAVDNADITTEHQSRFLYE